MTARAAKASTKKSKTVKAKTEPAAVNRPKSVEKQPNNKLLRAWNLRVGVLLLALAVAVVVAGNDTSAPLTTQYLAKDALASEAAGSELLGPATRHLWDVPVSWLVAKFLAIFGLVFLLAATVLRTRYDAWMAKGVNKLRWVALGLGGGTVFTTVAMLSGVSDVTTLGLIWGSVVLAGLLAAAAELLGPGRRLRRLLGLGALLAVFLPWLTFVRTFGAVPMYDGSLPGYMYYLYASLTLLVIAVALALFMRLKLRGKWADALYAEKAFMALSLAAAVLPALQIFAGALQS